MFGTSPFSPDTTVKSLLQAVKVVLNLNQLSTEKLFE